jgi:quinol monooxygenase YgiN
MSEPIVFISHFKVKEGKLDGLKQRSREVTKLLDAEKPRTLVFLAYVDESGTQVTFVHVFADAESMDLHVQGAEERTRAAYEFVEPQGFEIYGTPSDRVLEMMRQGAATSGVKLSVQSEHMGGFIRLKSG